MAATIDHPDVIPVYDTGLFEDSLYIVMRYVAGGDLRELLTTSGPLSPEQTVEFLLPVARALDTAHTHGLVHRDVKPANVLLQRAPDGTVQHVYLSDFGVTKQVGSVNGLTGAGAMVGTVDYMSPEQIQGGEVSPQTDVYALGVRLSPVPHRPVAVRSRLGGGDPVRPRQRGGRAGKQAAARGAPRARRRIAKGMAKLPGDRFATCRAARPGVRRGAGYRSGRARPGVRPGNRCAWPGGRRSGNGRARTAFDEEAVPPRRGAGRESRRAR